MRIPPYWSKAEYSGLDRQGRTRAYQAWGWSFESEAAAHAEAVAKARRIFDGGRPDKDAKDYDYLERPLREEIIEEICVEDMPVALITRNRYGAVVLNTASVCFVDIDFPPPRPRGLLDGLALLFSKERRRERMRSVREDSVKRVLDWARQNPHHAFRLYETAAGLRVLFTDTLYNPVSDSVQTLFDALGTDPLYRRLTIRQECFRARITPKPWRCGCERPPNRYPWESDAEAQAYRQWEQRYNSRIAGYGVCRLLAELGNSPANPAITSVVALHDDYACLDSALPLA